MKLKPIPWPRFRHTRPVLVPLLAATAVSVVVAKLFPSLGWNLVGDAIALWFGLFVVEVALEKGRAEVQRPAHRAMVDDLVRLRMPITHMLSLLLWETATMADLPVLRAASKGEGDIATILARRRLISTPAPMRQLGVLSGAQLSWWQVIAAGLSPQALRLEVLIARYITIADAPTLAALQALEASLFMDVLRGRIAFDDDLILEIFWRSLIQSLAALDQELNRALALHSERGSATGPASYIDFAVLMIERGERAPNAA